jgi:hypothetical protein
MAITNAVVTQLSRRSGTKLEVEVRTDDLGSSNKAGVHLFDKNGKFVDVALSKFKGKVGSDDVFSDTLDLSKLKLPKGFDKKSLGLTSYVDVPGADRLWEGVNHAPKPLLKNALVDLNAGNAVNDRRIGQQTASGNVDMNLRTFTSQGNKSATGNSGVTEIKFVDTNNQFKGAAKVDVVMHPVLSYDDRREHSDFWTADYVKKDLALLDMQNTVTLKRQADGSYAAKAPAGKAFFNVPEASLYYGDTTRLSGVKFAITAGGKWDNNGGADYLARAM